ncbi:sugar ABC transporter substrate-binding protein [Cryobacterium sp. PH29-G1]|uniref:ABC transporter substrate-binding protein n=1 Tax=Cryobacterium sp. PH29-G1 TaxID=3046211 RepID=UPI0024B9A3F6|nr:sugar ABC transporter substrate-binding protein [Cryobacterium sp. PH29-G1]MDJ0348825.1 sugar ABC transporter substrate-binding protein [Cryobacterium sp. PH29-G1]
MAGALALAPQAGSDTTLTMRVWDEQVAKSYETSFAAFETANPGITVAVNVVPWADYFTKLRVDVAGETADDVFWVNAGNFADYAVNGNLVNVTDALGADAQANWQPSVISQYTLDGALWGVPQLADPGIGLYYNADLLAAAGIDAATVGDLHWDPAAGDDTLLPVLQKLTVDANGNTADSADFDASQIVQYGYNAANDLNAIYLNYLGSNGAALQDGDEFVFDTAAGEQAFQYVIDLMNKYHVAPSAADTNLNGDFSLDQFLQGKMALFQSGVYNLSNVNEGAGFEWGVATIPAGPAGAISVTNGVVAAGNAASAHPEETQKLLEWLGSTEGSAAIGADGSASPAVIGAQASYVASWQKQGVDVQAFIDVLDNGTVQAPRGAKWAEGSDAFKSTFAEMFLGRIPVGEALHTAQAAANEAIAE